MSKNPEINTANHSKVDPVDWSHVIRPRKGWVPLDIAELFRYRELLGFLIWRNIIIRYKQTAIGVAWAVLQPLLTMVVFTFVFGKLAGMENDTTAPYAVMTFAAILPWQFFSNALTTGSNSVVAAGNMVRKIYFPRLFIPFSDSMSGILDFGISLIMLAVLMALYKVSLTVQLLLIPAFSLIALLAALGAALWFGALNVKYRDIKYIVPFITRMGMYISPVGFMTSTVPDQYRFWYSLNPLVGVIDGFRWAILGPEFEPYWPGFWLSSGIVVLFFVSGLYYFRATEKTFADLI